MASSHDETCPRDLFQGLVAGTSPLVCADLWMVHALCVSYVIKIFQLRFVHGQSQKREQKQTTKNFVAFYNHSLILTMQKPCELRCSVAHLQWSRPFVVRPRISS